MVKGVVSILKERRGFCGFRGSVVDKLAKFAPGNGFDVAYSH
jgi:hypothetical protein